MNDDWRMQCDLVAGSEHCSPCDARICEDHWKRWVNLVTCRANQLSVLFASVLPSCYFSTYQSDSTGDQDVSVRGPNVETLFLFERQPATMRQKKINSFSICRRAIDSPQRFLNCSTIIYFEFDAVDSGAVLCSIFLLLFRRYTTLQRQSKIFIKVCFISFTVCFYLQGVSWARRRLPTFGFSCVTESIDKSIFLSSSFCFQRFLHVVRILRRFGFLTISSLLKIFFLEFR
jgi:hypothetical protein